MISDLIRYHCVNVEYITERFYDYFKCLCVVGGSVGGNVYLYIWEKLLLCSSVVSRKV